jgi:hypothetical protein
VKIAASPLGSVLLLSMAIVLISGFCLPAQPVSAGSEPQAVVMSPSLQQGGVVPEWWDAFWAQFKVWLAQLADVFAQMPVVGPVLAAIINMVGASNVWICGAVIFVLFLLGALAIRR